MINTTHLNAKEREIHQQASRMLAEGVDATDFSVRFFGPKGALSALARNREERSRLLQTELYRWLKAEYARLRLSGGEFTGT